MGINDSQPSSSHAFGKYKSGAQSGKPPPAFRTLDSLNTRSTIPLEVSKDLVMQIAKPTKRHKQKTKPIFRYRPLFSPESHSIINVEKCKEENNKVSKLALMQPQSANKLEGARSVLATIKAKSEGLDSPQQNMSPPELFKSASTQPELKFFPRQISAIENNKTQTNLELLTCSSNRSPRKQDQSRSSSSQYINLKMPKRGSQGEDLFRIRVQPKVEISVLNTKGQIDRKPAGARPRRSSILKVESRVSSPSRPMATSEGQSVIRRMNTFMDKEELKEVRTVVTNKNVINKTDSVAFVLHKKMEELRHQKTRKKVDVQAISKAEKKRHWVGSNGKFDSDRLKSWYTKMHDYS